MCLPTVVKEATVESFALCQKERLSDPSLHTRLSVTVNGSLMFLICSCSLGCTLRFSAARTAALWGLRCLTDPSRFVRGAITTASLLSVSKTCLTPIVSQQTAQPMTQHSSWDATPETDGPHTDDPATEWANIYAEDIKRHPWPM